MAVFKATSYTKSKQRIKASVRYIRERRGRDGERIVRELFNQDGRLEKEQFYRVVDNAAEGTYFYRFMISPDPKLEDTLKDLDLREITEQVMAVLEEKLKGLQSGLQFVATIHDDHRPHRHVHAIALLSRRLNVADLAQLHDAATEAALAQRQELDLARQYVQEQAQAIRTPGRIAAPAAKQASGRDDVDRRSDMQVQPARIGQTCPRCGPGNTMKELAENVHWCPTCKFLQKQNFSLQLQGEEAAWER